MGCKFCITLRSSVFFGASVHIFLASMQFALFWFQVIQYLRYTKRPEQASLTWISFLIALMGAIFFPLGCIIFRGVEKEKLNLVRIPMWLFLFCKITEVTLKIYQEGALLHPQRRVNWEDRLYHAIDILGSAAYFLLLFFYSRKLQQLSSSESLSSSSKGGGGGGRSSSPGSEYFKASDVDDLSVQKKKFKISA